MRLFWRGFGGLIVCGISSLSLIAETAAQPSPSPPRPPARTKVVGGESARLSDWPWLATLRYNDASKKESGHVCGGTVIAPEWILTAAHCLIQLSESNTLFGSYPDDQTWPATKYKEGVLEVVLGVANLGAIKTDNVYSVSQIVVHSKYVEAFKSYVAKGIPNSNPVDLAAQFAGFDIALIKIARPWTGELAKLSLSGETDPTSGVLSKVAGYGYTESDSKLKANNAVHRMKRVARSNGEVFFSGYVQLQDVQVPTVDTTQCKANYAAFKDESNQFPLVNAVIGGGQICAGTENGEKDSCTGDSGGPLVRLDAKQTPFQIGVVSWGVGCGAPGLYGIYTRVSAYADWIQDLTGPLTGQAKGLMAVASAEAAPQQLAFTRAAILQLTKALAPAQGQVAITLPSGPRLKLGDTYAIQVDTKVAGRLVLVDIDAAGTVTQIFPNQFTTDVAAASVRAGQTLRIPPADGSWRLGGFQAVEPLGTGQLIALVVPEEFPIARTVASPTQRTKGLAPVEATPYLMNLVEQVEQTVAKATTAPRPDALKGWALGNFKYDITR